VVVVGLVGITVVRSGGVTVGGATAVSPVRESVGAVRVAVWPVVVTNALPSPPPPPQAPSRKPATATIANAGPRRRIWRSTPGRYPIGSTVQ
jgi:hypothetical protein